MENLIEGFTGDVARVEGAYVECFVGWKTFYNSKMAYTDNESNTLDVVQIAYKPL